MYNTLIPSCCIIDIFCCSLPCGLYQFIIFFIIFFRFLFHLSFYVPTGTLLFSIHLMVYVAGSRGLRRRDIPSAPYRPTGGRWDVWGDFPAPGTSPHVMFLNWGGPIPGFPSVPVSHSSLGGSGIGPPRWWAGLALLLSVWTPRAVQFLSAPGVCAPLAPPCLPLSIS